jgi:alpha-mannosidase
MKRAVRSTLALFCLWTSALIADETQPRRIYLALDDHTDYMWTADEETFRGVFVRTLDYYLDLADKTADQPAALQSRFNCDGAIWLWAYEHCFGARGLCL